MMTKTNVKDSLMESQQLLWKAFHTSDRIYRIYQTHDVITRKFSSPPSHFTELNKYLAHLQYIQAIVTEMIKMCNKYDNYLHVSKYFVSKRLEELKTIDNTIETIIDFDSIYKSCQYQDYTFDSMIQMMFYSYFDYFALASSNIMRILEEIILDEMYGILEYQKIMAEFYQSINEFNQVCERLCYKFNKID